LKVYKFNVVNQRRY